MSRSSQRGNRKPGYQGKSSNYNPNYSRNNNNFDSSNNQLITSMLQKHEDDQNKKTAKEAKNKKKKEERRNRKRIKKAVRNSIKKANRDASSEDTDSSDDTTTDGSTDSSDSSSGSDSDKKRKRKKKKKKSQKKNKSLKRKYKDQRDENKKLRKEQKETETKRPPPQPPTQPPSPTQITPHLQTLLAQLLQQPNFNNSNILPSSIKPPLNPGGDGLNPGGDGSVAISIKDLATCQLDNKELSKELTDIKSSDGGTLRGLFHTEHAAVQAFFLKHYPNKKEERRAQAKVMIDALGIPMTEKNEKVTSDHAYNCALERIALHHVVIRHSIDDK